ncbi:hypothetical protein L211DRAFT_878004 [Terfezia boudieri ATCC MYA-4762]|uniref:Uncharacterized protein n=1 Tax=Terfezia boudieri ATCC MYA-4762 TaxID=1051890 RepID=A0A3N4LTB1_9PEZI|nr:hypothetical protein L211DRAFT_878004 [Terfezia boudieri ATCC MYA-4762]
MGAPTNHLPARSNGMMRRAFPGPKRVPQRIQSTRLRDSPGSAPTASAIGSGSPQQASSTYDSIRQAPSIPPASAPPSHVGTPTIGNWQHTAIDPSLEGNILNPSLQTGSQGFVVNQSIMAELLSLITAEKRTTPYGGSGRLGENRESPMYELVARGLPDEETYQDYLHSEMEKLVNNFEVEFNAYLQRQNHPSITMKLSGGPSQQSEINPMAKSGKSNTDTLSRQELAVPTMESRKSYGPIEGSETLGLLVPEPEALVFIDHNLIPGLQFDWDSSDTPPSLPRPHSPPSTSSIAQGYPNFQTGFEGYLQASKLPVAMGSFQGSSTHSHMSPHFQSGLTSFPIKMPRQNTLQMNQMQYIQAPTHPDGMVMQAPQVSNSGPQQVPSFSHPYNLSPSHAPSQLHTCPTTGPSFQHGNMRKRSGPDP